MASISAPPLARRHARGRRAQNEPAARRQAHPYPRTAPGGPPPSETIERRIYLIRSRRVMLDNDLAEMYGVETKALNRAVKRNLDRFPDDFMLRVTAEEAENLRLQIGTSRWGGRRYRPYMFTQEGIGMLSGVLRSKRAVQVNIVIMRAFVRLREMMVTHKDLAPQAG